MRGKISINTLLRSTMFDMQNEGWMLRGITLILRKVMVDVTKYYTCYVKKRWISLRARKMSRRHGITLKPGERATRAILMPYVPCLPTQSERRC